MTDLCEQKLINALLEVEHLTSRLAESEARAERLRLASETLQLEAERLTRLLEQATIFNDGLTRRIERLEVDMARITDATNPPG